MSHSDFQAGFSRTEAPPLAAGVVRGIRVWRIERLAMPTLDRPQPGLLIGQHGHEWCQGENVAECHSIKTWKYAHHLAKTVGRDMVKIYYRPGLGSRELTDEPPCTLISPDCTCGFYAYWDLDADELSTSYNIVGVIEGYGRTTIGEYGFRCEKARIIALAPAVDPMGRRLGSLGNSTMQAMSERYEVPVFSTPVTMLEKFPTDDGPEVGKSDEGDDAGRQPKPTAGIVHVHPTPGSVRMAMRPSPQAAALLGLPVRSHFVLPTRAERFRDWWEDRRTGVILCVMLAAWLAYMVAVFLGVFGVLP